MSVDGEERVRAPHGEREECEPVGGDRKTGSQDWNPRPLHLYSNTLLFIAYWDDGHLENFVASCQRCLYFLYTVKRGQ